MEPTTKQQIMDVAKQLPRSQQIDLALELWDAVDIGDADFPLTDAQRSELDRRIAASDTNPQPPEDVEVIKARLRRGGVLNCRIAAHGESFRVI